MSGSSTLRWSAVAVLGVALVTGAVVVFYRSEVRGRWLDEAKAHEQVTARSIEAFCAAQEVLAREPFFQRPVANEPRDAAPVMSAFIGWGDTSEDGGVPVPRGSVDVPKAMRPRLGGSVFMDALTDGDLAAVDTAFVATLHDFDRWELTGGGGPLVGAASWHAASAPLPNFVAILDVAKMHLKRGAKEGHLIEAARDVRQLAWLSYSTESLLGGMVGLALLAIERTAWEWAGKHDVATTGWTPVPEPTTEKAKKVLAAAPAFFNPLSSEATFARAMACDKVTRCAALTEAATVTSGLSAMLDEPWRARARALSTATDAPRGGCWFSLARYFANHPMSEGELVLDQPMLEGDVAGMVLTLGTNDGAVERAFGADAGR